MTYRYRALLLLCLPLLLVGCADQKNPTAAVESVTPSVVTTLATTRVAIRGRNFFAAASLSLDDNSPAEIDVQWRVRIGAIEVAAADTVRASREQIDIVIPADLAPGVYDVTAVSPTGVPATLPAALTIVTDPVGLPIHIEDAPGGTGASVGARTLLAGEVLALFAVLRDTNSNFVSDISVEWSVDGGIGTVAGGPSSSTQLLARTVGQGIVRVAHAIADDAATGKLTVSPGPPTGVIIADRADALGVEVGDITNLTADDELLLYAVSRDAFSNFVAPVSVTWSVSNNIGVLPAGPADRSTLTLTTPGTGRASIAHNTLAGDDTGDLDVASGRAASIVVAPDTFTMTTDTAPVAFSVTATDADANPTSDLGTISWQIGSGPIGVIDASTGVFDPTTTGVGSVRATSSHGPADDSGSITVLQPAALSATLSIPSTLSTGQTFDVVMTVTNTGQADANNVVPSAPTVTGTGGASLLSGPSPVSQAVPAGLARVFTWRYLATITGSLEVGAYASGVDAINSTLVTSNLAASNSAAVADGLLLVQSDPFGDNTSFAYVFAHAGYVHLGPRKDGAGAVRFLPDGSGAQSVSFVLPADTATGTTQNSSPPPYPSIGTTGCVVDTAACGPDNENGRGYFASGTILGTEWLLLAGASSNPLDYVYMTSDSDTTLDFSFVDLDDVVSDDMRGVSAVHMFQDRVYIGSPSTKATRPVLTVLLTTPTWPGLDVVKDVHAVQLDADQMPGLKGTAPTMIDTITDFNDRLYLANRYRWYRSTTAQPQDYSTAPGDWADVTPSSSAFMNKVSVSTLKVADLEPLDKAVPQMATYNGRLYAAHNTTTGPQLLVCNPAISLSATDCDADDWSLVAPNSMGDGELTQFNNPDHTAIGFVAATQTALSIGFDNANGVTVFRTIASNPTTAADFSGDAGCSAADHPISCDGLGGPGLGDPGNTRLMDGKTLNVTPPGVYVTTGNGTSTILVYRLP